MEAESTAPNFDVGMEGPGRWRVPLTQRPVRRYCLAGSSGLRGGNQNARIIEPDIERDL